jgi:prolycopene isomerase
MAGFLYSAHIEGQNYLKGGTQVLANTLVKARKNYGGELQLNTKVTKILIENNIATGAETAKGNKISAKYIVSNADARQTYSSLIGSGKFHSKFLNHLEQMKPSISYLQVFLGVDMNPREKGIIEHEILCYPSYNLDYEYNSDLQVESEETFGICIPTLLDPSLAPENKHVISLITAIPYDYRENWGTENGERGSSYEKLKNETMYRLIKTAERFIPDLSKHIVYSEAATPLTLERYTANYKGAAYGWASTIGQSGVNRLQPKTPIKNLYLAGHWTTPGGGVIAVALSGRNIAKVIIGAHLENT